MFRTYYTKVCQNQEAELPPQQVKECIGPIQYTGKVFHGAATPFNFSSDPATLTIRDIEYSGAHMRDTLPDEKDIWFGIEASTLGYGLYCTPDSSEASKYAVIRSSSHNPPILHTLSLESAPLYDFRQQGNEQNNGVVSLPLAEDWRNYFHHHMHEISDYLKSKHPHGGYSLERSLEIMEQYKQYLEKFLTRLKNKQVWIPEKADEMIYGVVPGKARGLDLRDLLRTHLGDRGYNTPLHGGLWGRFMKNEKKCDGAIYIERGDNADFKASPTVVLYSLNQIKNQGVTVVSRK